MRASLRGHTSLPHGATFAALALLVAGSVFLPGPAGIALPLMGTAGFVSAAVWRALLLRRFGADTFDVTREGDGVRAGRRYVDRRKIDKAYILPRARTTPVVRVKGPSWGVPFDVDVADVGEGTELLAVLGQYVSRAARAAPNHRGCGQRPNRGLRARAVRAVFHASESLGFERRYLRSSDER